MTADILQPLRDAITTGDHAAIQAAIPEAPTFLPALFRAAIVERDVIIAGIFPALPTDEDRWEIIEAATQDSIARPERNALLAVIPYIPADLIPDAQKLAETITDTKIASTAMKAINARAASLGVALNA